MDVWNKHLNFLAASNPGIMFPYLSTIFSPVTYCWAVTAPTFSFHTPLDVTGESPDVHNIMTTELALTSADYLATLGGQIHPPICPGGVPSANYSVEIQNFFGPLGNEPKTQKLHF